MAIELPDLTIKHRRIENPDSSKWNLTCLVYEGGAKVRIQKANSKEALKFENLTIKYHQISIIRLIKSHAEALLELGGSVTKMANVITCLKTMFRYLDATHNRFDSVDKVRQALFDYSEYQYTRANLRKIQHNTAYQTIEVISLFLNGVFENLDFQIVQTRLKVKRKSRRALSREAEKVMLSDARQLARFCFEITQNFDPSLLKSGTLPILVEVNHQMINLTPGRKNPVLVDSDFTQTQAYLAFNLRVTAEIMIFLGMTVQNQAPTYTLKRSNFAYKSLGESYEVREYKHRRGGEVLFKIPKPYKPYFEKYLSFIDEYAPDSEWLFPYLVKNKGFRKRTDSETSKLGRLCSRFKIPWVKPSAFRKIGENILMRLANDEKTAADYANHAVSTFRQSYEFPSLQRGMIEISRFWDKTDPLIQGKLKVSLFNSPCNGVPLPIDDASEKLPEPDCITPTGCIGCMHYRDEESFDYVWGLQSFKFLKIVESSSHRTEYEKPSSIAIDWVNLKIDWFKSSEKSEHQEWVEEASIRIEEGDYHPSWSRKIEKFGA